jgi:hypothetical protein
MKRSALAFVAFGALVAMANAMGKSTSSSSADCGVSAVTAKFGTFYVCGPTECPTFQIAAKHLTDDLYFETLTTFDVDHKTGIVRWRRAREAKRVSASSSLLGWLAQMASYSFGGVSARV